MWSCGWKRRTLTFPGSTSTLSHTPKKGSLFHPLFPAVSLLCEINSQWFENCRKPNLEMEEAMMEPDDRRKKCFGCTSLRTGTIIIGAFDILLSTIAIVVSVVAMMNAQVLFLLFWIWEIRFWLYCKVKSELEEETSWSAASQCKRRSYETLPPSPSLQTLIPIIN